jgi:putative transposase
MARALRIDLAGNWYHVMNRGHRGGTLFVDDTDRRRFLGLVAELSDRFALEVHAFVLMDNHYHLLARTTEPNLSHAVRWLNGSYAVKFNWAHRCRGTVFQGRFKSVIIQEDHGAVEVARYIHLNPVRIGGLGLSKSDQRRAKVLGCEDPGSELVKRRLAVLHEYRWSSWRVYHGSEPAAAWLETGVISKGCGGRSRTEQRAALQAYTERPIRQGGLESPWTGLVGGLVLGEAEFARRLLGGAKVNQEEQTEVRRMRRRVSWEQVVRAAEKIREDQWVRLAERHGDWSRDGAIYVAVRHGGLRLVEVVREIGRLRYQAAAQAVKRFGEAMLQDPDRQRFVSKLKRHSSNSIDPLAYFDPICDSQVLRIEQMAPDHAVLEDAGPIRRAKAVIVWLNVNHLDATPSPCIAFRPHRLGGMSII